MSWFLLLGLLTGPVLVWTLTCTDEYKAISSIMCIEDSSMFTSGSVSEADKQSIIDIHNGYRAGVTPTSSNMRKAVWDDHLASLAQKWAQQCEFEHTEESKNKILEYNYEPGQNLAYGYADWTLALNGWHREVQYFTYGEGGNTEGKMTGHYTQVVQDVVAKIGCGFANCDNTYSKLYVCNYIGGNYNSNTPYKQGTPCADCSGQCSDGKLCDCAGKYCFNGGKLDMTTCTCTCSGGDYGGDQCATKLSSECSENPQCHTSSTGCEWKGVQDTPENCATYGEGGEDSGYCVSKGGSWAGCDECKTYGNVPKQFCPKMCAICPE